MSWVVNNGFIVLVFLLAIAKQCNSQFQGCDSVINVRPGTSYLESPYYPNQYAARSSCRYRIVAPLDHVIQMTCQLNLPANGNACTTDYFYIARDGDVQLRGSEQLCGSGSVARSSLFRTAVLAYISNGGRGSFRCTFNVHDIAILQTAKDIQWSRGVGSICLPSQHMATNTFEGEFANVLGWGTKFFAGPTSNTLQKVKLQVISNEKCQAAYRETQIFDTHLCTYDNTYNRRDSCQFDSGGPVIKNDVRQTLIGIISYGDACALTPNATGVNTRITPYLDWIRLNTGFSTCNKLT